MARRFLDAALIACRSSGLQQRIDISDSEPGPQTILLPELWGAIGVDLDVTAALAENLLLQMMEFVIRHELAHLARGHLEIAEPAADAFIDEREVQSSPARQFEEYEADVWAVQLFLQDILNDAEGASVEDHLPFRTSAMAWLMALMCLDLEPQDLGVPSERLQNRELRWPIDGQTCVKRCKT